MEASKMTSYGVVGNTDNRVIKAIDLVGWPGSAALTLPQGLQTYRGLLPGEAPSVSSAAPKNLRFHST
jgi:hypothetical protein